MRRAAAYIRVSSPSQDFATQRADIKRAMEARGDRPAPRFWFEEKQSGDSRRPALQKLRAAARAGYVSRVYIFHFDRLSRAGIRDTLTVVEEFWNCGVEVISVHGPFDVPRGPLGELVLSVLAYSAQEQLRKIRDNIRAARARVEREGGRWGRPRNAELDPKTLRQAQTLRRNHSLREVAELLGVPHSTLGDALAGKGHYARRRGMD